MQLGRGETARREAYRALFDPELPVEVIDDIRLALNQGQPLGNPRFIANIERKAGMRCEPRQRGRPRKSTDA